MKDFGFYLFCGCITAFGFYVGQSITEVNHAVNYYATFENGDTVKVDSVIAVPILSVEQVSKMWPEYYAETTINVEGKKILLRSEPFLFCDNPDMEGCYAGRDVYAF